MCFKNVQKLTKANLQRATTGLNTALAWMIWSSLCQQLHNQKMSFHRQQNARRMMASSWQSLFQTNHMYSPNFLLITKTKPSRPNLSWVKIGTQIWRILLSCFVYNIFLMMQQCLHKEPSLCLLFHWQLESKWFCNRFRNLDKNWMKWYHKIYTMPSRMF